LFGSGCAYEENYIRRELYFLKNVKYGMWNVECGMSNVECRMFFSRNFA
jgi:hypothetical protein